MMGGLARARNAQPPLIYFTMTWLHWLGFEIDGFR